jgi:hypothetical protein
LKEYKKLGGPCTILQEIVWWVTGLIIDCGSSTVGTHIPGAIIKDMVERVANKATEADVLILG